MDPAHLQGQWQEAAAERACVPLALLWWLYLLAEEQPEHHAPMWVPDYSSDYCMNCEKGGRSKKFTALNRRVRRPMCCCCHPRQHHCRNCGAVVCGACSSKKFVLAHQSAKPLRVCDACYLKYAHVRP